MQNKSRKKSSTSTRTFERIEVEHHHQDDVDDEEYIKTSPPKLIDGSGGDSAERIKTETEMYYGTDIKHQDDWDDAENGYYDDEPISKNQNFSIF